MNLILSKITYYIGDLVSRFLYFDCFGWLYPLYRKLMIISYELDAEEKVWHNKDE